MKNKENLNFIEEWIGNVSIYPPSEIYFQAPKKLEKEERRVKSLCEQLYRFNWENVKIPNPVGSTRDVVREMSTLDRLFENDDFPPKYENIVKLVAKFLFCAYHLRKELDDLHGKHPKLKQYYEGWSVGELHLSLNATHWGAKMLRLGTEGPDHDNPTTRFLDDVQKQLEKIKK